MQEDGIDSHSFAGHGVRNRQSLDTRSAASRPAKSEVDLERRRDGRVIFLDMRFEQDNTLQLVILSDTIGSDVPMLDLDLSDHGFPTRMAGAFWCAGPG